MESLKFNLRIWSSLVDWFMRTTVDCVHSWTQSVPPKHQRGNFREPTDNLLPINQHQQSIIPLLKTSFESMERPLFTDLQQLFWMRFCSFVNMVTTGAVLEYWLATSAPTQRAAQEQSRRGPSGPTAVKSARFHSAAASHNFLRSPECSSFPKSWLKERGGLGVVAMATVKGWKVRWGRGDTLETCDATGAEPGK